MGNKNSSAATASSNAKHVKPVSGVFTGTTVNRRMNIQRMQNVLLIWLDSNINENNADCNNTVESTYKSTV
ncbi:unnamed protein product [Adineta steineri]|uniref:Uncharacterized protein n=1 Tax=Adineta steineri TaxID=433720 RepID=A0A819KEZ8_9BILA|nr:unnamed protein product [Adineta steineri]